MIFVPIRGPHSRQSLLKCSIMGRSWIGLSGLLVAGATPTTAPATAAELDIPVACAIGTECLIQKFFDHDPSAERLDYRCGNLTTDGHDGIDFRLRTMAEMNEGVAVLAAADGTVLRVRDGEPDVSVKVRGHLNGRDAGNGVVIDHGQGWETQYSHLRRGSLRVKPGDRVRRGDPIGLIGMSGNTEYPHLHFALRIKGQPVDPFTGPWKPGDCIKNDSLAGSLWTRNAARALGYRPSAVVAISLASSIPPASVADRPGPALAPGRSDSLILWVDLFGTRAGDTQRFRIVGPGNAVLFERTAELSKGNLTWFAYAGRRAPVGGWPEGLYSGEYELVRNGAIVARGASQATIR